MIGPRILLALFLLLPLNGLASAAPAEDEHALLQEIERLEHECGVHLGVMAKNLNTGEIIRYNASERFPTASVIKLPVMAVFFHLVDLHWKASGLPSTANS